MQRGLGTEVPPWQLFQFYSLAERIRVAEQIAYLCKTLRIYKMEDVPRGLHSSRKQERTFSFYFLLYNMQKREAR